MMICKADFEELFPHLFRKTGNDGSSGASSSSTFERSEAPTDGRDEKRNVGVMPMQHGREQGCDHRETRSTT
ncbi:hypothetical protein GE300_19825 [Rhodobacteraceae bacterium 2CG4]|uniref:Uncharacterized protein n=1 Tax=Halovulum marinum TaxID=2662447 RepID=A0A6L5Z5W5_9RHOB|nr:hypothetical protein [Halovulum marinum]MSU91827.1 hypothetical protein [Halovulum marinum]